jgi:hypothetical protein
MSMTSKEIAESAIRLDNDVNGNPRYYIPLFMFSDASGNFYRPKYCRKYTGKKYGAGWIFQSYSLESDIRESIK